MDRAAAASEHVVRETDRDPRRAEGRREDARGDRRVAPGREVPEHGPEGEVQGDRDHRDGRDERHAETGSAAPLPSSKRDHGRGYAREEPEKREARDEGDRLVREVAEDTGI